MGFLVVENKFLCSESACFLVTAVLERVDQNLRADGGFIREAKWPRNWEIYLRASGLSPKRNRQTFEIPANLTASLPEEPSVAWGLLQAFVVVLTFIVSAVP
jgi:hypothetical protein